MWRILLGPCGRILRMLLIPLSFSISCNDAADRVGNFYKIEVNFTKFENPKGLTRGGYSCDNLSSCDPYVYAYIDMYGHDRGDGTDTENRISPTSKFPGASRPDTSSFSYVTGATDRNIAEFASGSNGIVYVICKVGQSGHELPKLVNARVEVRDRDPLTSDDIIEQFDCVFPFIVTRDLVEGWSGTRECTAIQSKDKFKLFYQWRVKPIYSTQCYVPP